MREAASPLVIRGWSIFAHPLFLDQVEALIVEVERARAKDPRGYRGKNSAKHLAAILNLAFDIIPEDPTRPAYRLGGALGEERRHWFRVKFFQQYRLFFRYSARERVIIYAWINDERTLRAYRSGTDAYRVFNKMLERGNAADDWTKLRAEAEKERRRLGRIATKRSVAED